MVIPVRAGWRTAASSEPSQTLTSPCPLPICSRFLPQTPPPRTHSPDLSAFPRVWGRSNYQICVHSTLHPDSTSGHCKSCSLLDPSPVNQANLTTPPP